jgi:hypothetical protein
MPFKCPCACSKNKTQPEVDIAARDGIIKTKAEQFREEDQKERRLYTTTVLKDVVYEGLMKKYFATG